LKLKEKLKAKKEDTKNNNKIKLIRHGSQESVGSSKNGRESESKRLGVKILVVKLLLLGTSS
jgi:hypothetical protein